MNSAVAIPQACRERVTAWLTSGERHLLGLVSPPGGGKSSFANALAEAWHPLIQVVPMDGFHLANQQLALQGRAQRKGAVDTFDGDGFVNLIQRLKTQAPGEVVYAPDFRRELEEPVAGAIAVQASTRLVVTEGNYLLNDERPWHEVRRLVDEVWYLDVDDDVRRARLLQRHMRFGRSRAEALRWIDEVDEPNAVRIAAQRQHADFFVSAY
jgi:pantothenate kinase